MRVGPKEEEKDESRRIKKGWRPLTARLTTVVLTFSHLQEPVYSGWDLNVSSSMEWRRKKKPNIFVFVLGCFFPPLFLTFITLHLYK